MLYTDSKFFFHIFVQNYKWLTSEQNGFYNNMACLLLEQLLLSLSKIAYFMNNAFT